MVLLWPSLQWVPLQPSPPKPTPPENRAQWMLINYYTNMFKCPSEYRIYDRALYFIVFPAMNNCRELWHNIQEQLNYIVLSILNNKIHTHNSTVSIDWISSSLPFSASPVCGFPTPWTKKSMWGVAVSKENDWLHQISYAFIIVKNLNQKLFSRLC